jgi:hypothetical protein
MLKTLILLQARRKLQQQSLSTHRSHQLHRQRQT